jgi:hypothetical protein
VTTALGPHGQKTVWYQSPDDDDDAGTISDSQIDPQLLIISQTSQAAAQPSSPPRAFGTNITAAARNDYNFEPNHTPPTTRAPKPSSVSREAIEKARLSIQKVKPKRSLLETMVELHE